MKFKTKKLLVLAIILLLSLSLITAIFEPLLYTVINTDSIATDSVDKLTFYYPAKNTTDTLATTNDYEVFLDNAEEETSIEVTVELAYEALDCDCKQEIMNQTSMDSTMRLVAEHRSEQKDYYQTKNAEYAEEIYDTFDIDCDVNISSYSPFIQFIFDDYADLADNIEAINSISQSDEVGHVDVGISIQETEDSATRVAQGDASNYTFEKAISDMSASDTIYRGEGINVGIIEAGGVAYSNSHTELNHLNIVTNSPSGTTASENSHAVYVTRLLCGSRGVAPNVDNVYIYYSSGTGSMINAVDWLIDNNCVLINASKSTQDIQGTYHWTSALLDYYVRFQFLTYVNSAGNDGDNDDHTTYNYAMGYNVIAVGALDSANNSSTYSSYGADTTIRTRKPTVSAPGTKIIFATNSNGTVTTSSGTSYSAPLTAGVVAKLMSQYPFLVASPEVVMSALITSATPVTGQDNDWDTYVGAGRVNYLKAKEAIQNYYSYCITENGVSTVREQFTISASVGRMKFSVVTLTNSTVTSSSDEVTKDLHTRFQLRIRNSWGAVQASCEHTSNILYINYENTTARDLTVELYQFAGRFTTYADYVAITWCYE